MESAKGQKNGVLLSFKPSVMLKKLPIIFAVASFLTACGGGGDDSPAAGVNGTATTPTVTATAEGAYAGTLTGSRYSSFSTVVLEDGQFWTLYGNVTGGTLFVGGFIQGQGTSTGNTFSSTNATDFGVSPAAVGSLSATFVPGTSLIGQGTLSGASFSFNGTTPAQSNYSTPALLSDIVGTWQLSSLTGNSTAVTITAAGTFTGGTAATCLFSGTIAPRPSGKNIFNVTLNTGAAPCAIPNSTVAGIAVSSLLNGGPRRQLVVASVYANRSAGAVLFGTR